MMRRSLAVAALTGIAAVGLAAAGMWLRPEPVPLTRVQDPIAARPPADASLPDVILVIGCTVRRDQLPMHGGPADTAPFLASLAAEGALFHDVVAAAPWTRPASTALLTGHHALSLGMVEPGSARDDRRLPDAVTTLAEHLRAAGYATVGATANPNLNAAFGFHQGFDEYLQLDRLWRDDMVKLGGAALVPEVRRLLPTVDAERPLYLQLMLVDAHAPYEATPRQAAAFAEPELPERVAEYRVALRRLDAVVEQVARTLRRPGREVVFVVVSDHGEGLSWPAHHGKAHGRFLAPSAVGALWALSGPGIGAGVGIDGVASQVDLVPTLLGHLGVPGYDGPGLDHSGLLAVGGTTARAEAFADTWFLDTDRAAIYTPTLACQRDFGGAPARGPFVDGCFDRLADPTHARPFDDPEAMARLAAWREARTAEHRAVAEQPAGTPGELGEMLEALGYRER